MCVNEKKKFYKNKIYKIYKIFSYAETLRRLPNDHDLF